MSTEDEVNELVAAVACQGRLLSDVEAKLRELLSDDEMNRRYWLQQIRDCQANAGSLRDWVMTKL
jgi:hypothetical protein